MATLAGMNPQLPPDNPALAHPATSDVRRNFERMAAIVLAGITVYLLATESLEWIPYVAGGVAAVIPLTIFWPYGCLLGLMAAASAPKWPLEIGSWHAKPEHLVVGVFGLALLVRMCTRSHVWKKLDKLDYLLAAFLVMNFVSSGFTSPDRGSTLRWALMQALAVAPAFLIGQLIRKQDQLDRAMSFWLGIGVAEALFGLLCYLSYLMFDTEVGIGFFDYLDYTPAVRGSQWEPNIFGSYCTCFAVMFLFYFVARETRRGQYLLGLSITGTALLMSLARQAWATFILVALFVLFCNFRRRNIPWGKLFLIVASVFLVLAVGVTLMKDLRDRLATLAISKVMEEPTLVRRASIIIQGLDDIKQHPLVGSGTNSFQLTNETSEDESQEGEAWLGCFFFRVLHDTGIIGTVILGWFFINLARRAWRILFLQKSPDVVVGALSAAILVMMIAYQLTDASTLAFMWINLGLFMAAIRIAEARASKTHLQPQTAA
jgi:O-Antigen ligase